MSSDLRIGGNDYAGRSHHAPLRTRRDLDSISTCPALERGKFTQSLLDVLAIASGVLLACATGVGFAFAIFVCVFVRIP